MANRIVSICLWIFRAYVPPFKLVNTLKTISSRIIRKEFADHINTFYWKPVFWTGAYCVICAGGAPLEVLKTYIQNQMSLNILSAASSSHDYMEEECAVVD